MANEIINKLTNPDEQEKNRRSFLKTVAGVFTGLTLFGGAGRLLAKTEKNDNASAGFMSPAAGPDSYIASICMFAGNFEPRGWAFCDGRLLSISQYSAVFALLGTQFGGNGTTTFALPDLRGRVPVGPGNGPGLTPKNQGQMGGIENVTLLTTQMPSHNHTATGAVTPKANTGRSGSTEPASNFPSTAGTTIYNASSNAVMGESPVTVTVQPAGNSQPHENMQPWTAINYIICLEGIFPSRN